MDKKPEDWLKETIIRQGKNSIFFKSDDNPFFTIQKVSLSTSHSGEICGEGQLYTLTANSILNIKEQIYVEKNAFSESKYLKRKDSNYTFGKNQVKVHVKDDSFNSNFKEMVPLFDCNNNARNGDIKEQKPEKKKTMPYIRPFDIKKFSNYDPENESIQTNLAVLLEQNIRCRGLNIPFKPFLNEKALNECVKFVKEHPDTAIRLWNKKYEKVQKENFENSKVKNTSLIQKITNQFKKDLGLTSSTQNNTRTNKGTRR